MHTMALVFAAALVAQRAPDMDLIAPAAFPHIRIDIGAKAVELDATVPIRLDDPRAPRVYLEQLVCIPDTKEHEVVLVTKARPSHVHAALLAIGLEPGKPATWRQEGVRMIPIAPEGDAVRVTLHYTSAAGDKVKAEPRTWIKNAATGEHWPEGDWVFAGSITKERQGRDIYEADAGGTLVGLTSFGTEVVAWPRIISPDSQIEEPEWIADAATVPPMGTKVTVRLEAVK